ncbi:unnamed protein product [Blepharisma stoltei]|uniref:TmcB/TmcC TPR repeats domain-containing protein n=1 Tax=Blepharisma stoltei TaxID=1481888 RepID=A0AAU9IB74_9CILI|nr:unnamed protein product [Blepharisma stoltei]
MSIPEAGINQSYGSCQWLWKNKKLKTIKESVFEFYCQLYHNGTNEEISLLWQKVGKEIEDLVWCFQIMSLLWIPNLPIKDWKNNIEIWEIIGYFRIDNICSEFGIIDAYSAFPRMAPFRAILGKALYLYLSIVVNFVLFFGIFTLSFMIYRSANLPRWVFLLLKWIFNFWANLIFIPSLVLYSIFLKYSFTPAERITEYEHNNEPASFEANITIQILIICAMIVNFPLILFHTQFSGEIRHSVSKKILISKAHSKINLHIAMLSYFSPIFYVLFDKDYIIYYQCLLMVISIILTIESLIFWPYFSVYCNLTLILRLFAISLVSFGFILGNWMDNSLLILLNTIVFGRLAAALIYQFVLKMQRNMIMRLPTTLSAIISAYKLEKVIRHSLILNDPEQKNQIIYLFETFFIENSLSRDKLQVIWVTNYCIFTLKDESLSKIKLSKTKNISGNLENDFQEYLCSKRIESLSSESKQFIEYFQEFHMIKKKDLKLCINLLKFWEEVVSLRPDTVKLSKNLLWIDKKLLIVDNKFTQLTTKFCNSKESLDLYASYTKSILFDREKSNLLENKSQLLSKTAKKSFSKNLEFFNEIYGIFVISCEEENFGEILFSNPKSSEILKSPNHNIDGTNIASLIPSYYIEDLNEDIRRIIHFASNSEIDLSGGFFLNDPSHYLLECSGKILITSHKNYLMSILLFKPKKRKHQVILISETGEICGYSENFPKFVTKNIQI